jgi:hypothetical protein
MVSLSRWYVDKWPGADSEMAKALATDVGEHLPPMKVLDPEEATGIVPKLRESVHEALQ